MPKICLNQRDLIYMSDKLLQTCSIVIALNIENVLTYFAYLMQMGTTVHLQSYVASLPKFSAHLFAQKWMLQINC